MKTTQAAEFTELIPDGATLMIGGFVGAGQGACTIDPALPFGLIRGGHLDVTVEQVLRATAARLQVPDPVRTMVSG